MAALMTVNEVADYLRVTKKTIYRLLGQGKIPAMKVGNQWRFDKASIDEWLQRSSVAATVNILVIDNNDTIRALFKDVLGELGHTVAVAETGSEGLELVRQRDFDMVFLDLGLSGMTDGAKLFHQLKATKPGLVVIITTGYPDSALMARVLAQGPFGVMNKPFSEQDIVTAITNFLGVSQRN